MKYYHITNTEKKTIESILKNGIQCNSEGEIFVFENRIIGVNNVINTIADIIAENQIFLNEYVMFEIDEKGFNEELINDNVGEFGSNLQWYIKQAVIDKKHIQFYGKFKTNYKPWYNTKKRQRPLTEEEDIVENLENAIFESLENQRELEKLNKENNNHQK